MISNNLIDFLGNQILGIAIFGLLEVLTLDVDPRSLLTLNIFLLTEKTFCGILFLKLRSMSCTGCYYYYY